MRFMADKELLVFVCPYSSTCDGNCLKCPYLAKAEVVDLAKLGPVPTIQGERGCDCG